MVADRPEDWNKRGGEGFVERNEELPAEDAEGNADKNVESAMCFRLHNTRLSSE
jgi:hypothetical protein